jgi:hypothetical protein
VQKTQDSQDGRVVHLSLTAEGQQLLTEISPVDVFAEAQIAIAKQEFSTIEAALNSTLLALQKANNAKSFGVCRSCVNFVEKEDFYLCNLTQLPLSPTDAKKICREHIPINDDTPLIP